MAATARVRTLFGGFLTAAATREQGLLTTASDERSGKPAHSRRLASPPLESRVFKPRAVARAKGVNNPASQSAPPLRQGAPGRRNQKAPRAFRRARTRKRPWVPGRPARYRTGNRWPSKPLRLPGGATPSAPLGRLPATPSARGGCPSNMARSKQRTSGAGESAMGGSEFPFWFWPRHFPGRIDSAGYVFRPSGAENCRFCLFAEISWPSNEDFSR
jgi:hypothetical protein